MKLGTYRSGQGHRLIRVTAAGWVDVAAAMGSDEPWAHDLGALIAAGPDVQARVREATEHAAGPVLEADESRLAPPVLRPSKILCIGLNYKEHAAETGHALPTEPEVFVRVNTTLVGPRDPVPMPAESERYDLESELCLVIGRGGRRIAESEALDHVFGYTVFNDLSVRDFQRRGTQWTPGKNWDGSGPCGPFVVTADEIGDPSNLDVSSDIDGFGMQSSNTRNLIFSVPALIADLTRYITLEPGDLIATGTPPGVGDARKPPRYLHVGEVARCTVRGIGSLENRVVAEEEWLRWRDARA